MADRVTEQIFYEMDHFLKGSSNLFSKSCKLFLNAHFVGINFPNKLPWEQTPI
jgi:hypothetical protein